MTYETITAEIDARGTKGVTLLTINRPQALNALNSQVLADLILGRPPAIPSEGLDMGRYGPRGGTHRPGRLAAA